MEYGDWVRVTRTVEEDGEPFTKAGRRIATLIWEGWVNWTSRTGSVAEVWGGDPGEAEYLVTTLPDDKVEVIDKPVTVFGPGDTVRSKWSTKTYTLGNGGYLRHGEWTWGTDLPGNFTSDNYYKVED